MPVAAGAHTLGAVIDWTGSEELAVQVAPGETVRVLIKPAGGWWGSINPLIAYSNHKYLSLVRTGPTASAPPP